MKKFFEQKQVHVGRTESASVNGNDTTILSHHLYILCHFGNYALCLLFASVQRRVVEGSVVGGAAWVCSAC